MSIPLSIKYNPMINLKNFGNAITAIPKIMLIIPNVTLDAINSPQNRFYYILTLYMM